MKLNIQGWLKQQVTSLFSSVASINTALASKMGVNVDNVSTTGKNNISTYCSPNWAAAVTAGYPTTAPFDGICVIGNGTNAAGTDVAWAGGEGLFTFSTNNSVTIPVKYGDAINVSGQITAYVYFVPYRR